MIVSHKYKFIFLKTYKTAGTSVEIALSQFCGPDDIITPIFPADEEVRRELGHRGPQHCYASRWKYGVKDVMKWMRRGKRKLDFYNHIAAVDAKKLLGPEIWDGYFKFCVERNPWDRVVSQYYWVHREDPRPPISEFIRSKKLLDLKRIGYDKYTMGGELAVDRVCKFENLAEEMELVRKQVGISDALELPRAKSNFRKDKRNYREILNEEDRQHIADVFSEEIELMGYEW